MNKKEDIKKYGEVFTPVFLVEQMLDTLPNEVWTNPNLTWLDPCVGGGVFPISIIRRLMSGLAEFEPNEALRRKHVLGMVYACELQEKNVELCLSNVELLPGHIYCGSYLDESFDKQMESWAIEKFDVIVMNPPYQELKEGNKKSQALWDKFVVKTIGQLVEGGYLVTVHPDGWRGNGKSFKEVKQLLKARQMLYLEVHNTRDGRKTFGVSTTYDFYCLHNIPNTMATIIKCQDGTIERLAIAKMEFIPNGMHKEFNSLLAEQNDENVELLHSFSVYETRKLYVSKEQTVEFKHPVVYATYKDGSVNFMYSNTKEKGHFGIPKVIFSDGGASTPVIDENGDYGLTQFAYAIIDEPENLQYIHKAMLHPDFINLMSFSDGLTGVAHRYNHKIIALFRKDFWKEYQ